MKKETQLSERREDNKVGLVGLGMAVGLSMLFSRDYVAHLNSSYCSFVICLQKRLIYMWMYLFAFGKKTRVCHNF